MSNRFCWGCYMSLQIERDSRHGNLSGGTAFAAALMLPAIGVACIFVPEFVASKLPYLLGGSMLLVGAADIITDAIDKEKGPGKISVGSDIVMIALGVVTMVNAGDSINFIAVVWGLLGLEKASNEFDAMIKARKSNDRWATPLAMGCFELLLGIMLLLDPLMSIGHHILLLGIELVTYPFRVS